MTRHYNLRSERLIPLHSWMRGRARRPHLHREWWHRTPDLTPRVTLFVRAHRRAAKAVVWPVGKVDHPGRS